MATRPKAVIESRNGEKLSPITITKNVLTDDGQNLHDILSDRKEDMMTPTIENSSSMFKVGQGDNVDYSENVVDGAYESLVFKGKSLVNLGREIDSQYHNISGEGTQITSDGYFKIPYAGSENSHSVRLKFGLLEPLIKPDTVYSLIVEIAENTTQNARIGFTGHNNLSCVEPVDTNTNIASTVGTHVKLIKRRSEVTARQSDLYFCIWDKANVDTTKHIKFRYMILEGDWTNKELPPYFEGMKSVQMPILTSTGKNLFNINGNVNEKYDKLSASDNPNIVDGNVIIPSSISNAHHGKGQKIKIKKGGTYTCSFTTSDEGIVDVYGSNLKNYAANKTSTFSFTASADCDEVLITFATRGGAHGGKIYNFQIEEGTVATPYEPYKSNILRALDDVELRGIGDIQDTLDCLTGEVIERIGEIVLNGSDDEEWEKSYETTNAITFRLKINNCYYENQWRNDSLKNDCGFEQVGWFYIYSEQVDKECYGVGDDNKIYIRILKSRLNSVDENGFKSYLSKNPITIQYLLKTETNKTVDLSGYPFSYENGHVILSSDSIEQSLTPTVEYSVVTNRNGQIRSNQKMVERHQKQLDRLQAMILTNLVNTQYEQALTNLKYDLKNVREEVK